MFYGIDPSDIQWMNEIWLDFLKRDTSSYTIFDRHIKWYTSSKVIWDKQNSVGPNSFSVNYPIH